MNNAIGALKPPTSFSQQVNLLKQRGLVITDEAEAASFLENVNYYRFSAYLLPYKSGEHYLAGVSFPTVKRVYEFDRRLRGLILSIFEPLEVMLRTTIAYHHSHTHGADGYYTPDTFAHAAFHERFMVEFDRAIQSNKTHPIIRHHLDQYGGHLPLWAAVEFFSFGMLSRFFANLNPTDRKKVAKALNCGPNHLMSWLQCLTDLRNRCAHYSRLYFTHFPLTPKLPKGPYNICDRRLFGILYVMSYLYACQIDVWESEFLTPLEALIEEYESSVDIRLVGFPINWQPLLCGRH